MTVLTGTIQKRNGTAAQWASANPVLLQGEEGLETDSRLTKTGNGTDNWNDLPYDNVSSSDSRLISGGGITVVTDDITVAEANYYISGQGNYTSPETVFNNIALSSTGTQRFVAFYGKTDSTVVKVEGTEGAVASMPDGPANSVLVNYSLVTDGAIDEGVDLSGYLLRSDKATPAEIVAGSNDTNYITPYALQSAKWYDISSARYSGKRYGALSPGYGTATNWTSARYYWPVLVGEPHTVTAMTINITTLFAGSNVRMALYSADSAGYPNARLADSGNLSSATTGDKTYTFPTPIALTGKLVYLSIQTSSASVGLLYHPSPAVILPRFANASTNPQGYSIAGSFATEPPATFPASQAVASFGGVPAVELTKQ